MRRDPLTGAATCATSTLGVTACGGGIWRSITPAGNGPGAVYGTVSAAVIVGPLLPCRLWLGTGLENDEVWRPGEGGGSWARVNTGPGRVEDGAPWSMAVDFAVPTTLCAVSGDGAQNLWKSTDGGIR